MCKILKITLNECLQNHFIPRLPLRSFWINGVLECIEYQDKCVANKKVSLPNVESDTEYFQELEIMSDVLIGRLLHKRIEQTKHGRPENYQTKFLCHWPQTTPRYFHFQLLLSTLSRREKYITNLFIQSSSQEQTI